MTDKDHTIPSSASGNPGVSNDVASENRQLREILDTFLSGKVIAIRWMPRKEDPVLYVSPNIEKVLGYPPDALLAGDIMLKDKIHPGDANRVFYESRLFTQRNEDTFEHQPYRVRRANGDYAWIADRTQIHRNPEGIPEYYISQWVDVTEVIEARYQQEQASALAASIIENAPVAIVISNHQGEIRLLNRMGQERLGYTFTGETSLHLNELMANSEERAVVRSLIEEMGAVEGMDINMRCRNGQILTSQVFITPIDYLGEPAFLTMALDVTQQRAQEDALRESEATHRAMFHNTSVGMELLAPDGILKDVNAAFESIVGMLKGEMAGKSILDFTHPDDRELTENLIEELRSGARHSARLEKRYVHKDGRLVWGDLAATAILNLEGETESLLGLVVDITDRKATEQALRESEATARALLNAPTDVILLLDKFGTILDLNDPSAKMLRASREELIGGNLWELSPEESEHLRRKNVEQAFLAGRPVFYEDRVEKTWFETMIHPIRDENGEVVRVAMIGRDITERKAAEEERLKLETRFLEAQKMESLSLLAGGIAHDFNNLLAGIVGNAGLALMDLSPIHPARDSVEQIETAAERATNLTRQMLAYSGKGKFVIEEFTLSTVIQDMNRLIQSAVSRKANLKYHLDPSLPETKGDLTQIRQVIMNLVMNASEALPGGSGNIDISTGSYYCDATALGKMTVGEQCKPGRYVYMRVTDTGEGMDPETQAKIFDPFFSTRFTGRGLGLAATLGILKGHHSAIDVQSTPGKGTTFVIYFPVAEAAAGAEGEPHYGVTEPEYTVLVVDDEESVRFMAQRSLEKVGFKVLLAKDGMHALEIYSENPDAVDVVLLDLIMPRMDGEETLEALREKQPDLPVLMTTGYSQDHVKRLFGDMPQVSFIDKPFKPQSLVNAIRALLHHE